MIFRYREELQDLSLGFGISILHFWWGNSVISAALKATGLFWIVHARLQVFAKGNGVPQRRKRQELQEKFAIL
jgi:hypothetical protein